MSSDLPLIIRGVCNKRVLPRSRLWQQVLDGTIDCMWEASGEIPGGRFVDGVGGEQYALPGAVEALRAVRRQEAAGETVMIAAADPLNLAGVLTPGPKVPVSSGHLIVYRDGLHRAFGSRAESPSTCRPASRLTCGASSKTLISKDLLG